MDSEFRTLHQFRMLLEKFEKSSDALNHLTLSRHDLLRQLECADEKSKKYIQEEVLKIDALIHHLYPNGI